MGDNLARDNRGRQQSSILTEISKARGQEPEAAADAGLRPEPDEKFVALPKPGSVYAAYSRPITSSLTTLRFMVGDAVKGLPYANLDSIDWEPVDKPGGGPLIVMVFAGVVARKVIITGRQMLFMYDMLTEHKISWVRELPKGRDFRERDDNATVVTSITIEPVKLPG